LSSARSLAGHHAPGIINHPEGHHADPNTQLFGRHKLDLMDSLEKTIEARTFIIDPYFNVNGHFAGRWWAGHWRTIREDQFAYAMRESTVRIERSADVIVLDCPPWMFHGSTDNPLLAMLHVTSTLRGYLPPHPLLRKGGVVICITPCQGMIDEWYRPSDGECLNLYAQVGNDINLLFDRYALDFLNRPEYIYKYRYCYGHHPIHAFLLLAAVQYAFSQASKVIFVGSADSPLIRRMGITIAAGMKQAWDMALAEVGRADPEVVCLPKCSKRMGLVFDVAAG
jgi:hypothetical protein